MSVSVREFNHFDVNEFEPWPDVFGDDGKKRTVDQARYGAYCYTFFDEAGVIGIGVCTPLYAGSAEFSTLLGDGLLRHPKEASLVIGETISHCFDMLKLFRGQAVVKEGYDKGVKWIERFGFVREGLMKNYSKVGENAYLYARYK